MKLAAVAGIGQENIIMIFLFLITTPKISIFHKVREVKLDVGGYLPKSYEFGYSVKDAKSGNDYDRREVSDGNVVRGEYRVQLPDGRTQIVTYHADWQTGFHADVRYEGEARYPETNNQGYNYNVPEYSGSLNGFHGNGNNFKPAYGPPGYH
ncbi:unnamed protein product, partial [Brenthis ino]